MPPDPHAGSSREPKSRTILPEESPGRSRTGPRRSLSDPLVGSIEKKGSKPFDSRPASGKTIAGANRDDPPLLVRRLPDDAQSSRRRRPRSVEDQPPRGTSIDPGRGRRRGGRFRRSAGRGTDPIDGGPPTAPDPPRASPKPYRMKKSINLWAFPYPSG